MREHLEHVGGADHVEHGLPLRLLAGAEGPCADGIEEGVLGVGKAGQARNLADGRGGAHALEVATQARMRVHDRGFRHDVERLAVRKQQVHL